MAVAVQELDATFDFGGNHKARFVVIEPDSSWLAAGEAVAVDGFERIEGLIVIGGGGGYVWQWDRAGQLLLAYYGDYSNASDGALVAVPDTTDLSALDLFCLVVGQ